MSESIDIDGSDGGAAATTNPPDPFIIGPPSGAISAAIATNTAPVSEGQALIDQAVNSPASSLYAASIADPVNGAETNNVVLGIITESGLGIKTQVLSSGTAAGMLAQWPAIVNYIDGYDQGGYTPIVGILLPGNVTIQTQLNTAYNYLVRTAATPPPVPPAVIAATAASVNNIYRNIAGTNADPAGLSFWTTGIDSGTLTYAQLLTALAYSAEAVTAINAAYMNAAGTPADPGGLSFWQWAFANGYMLTNLVTALAYSSETASAINTAWTNALGFGIDPNSLAIWQSYFASGVGLQALVSALAYSPGAAAAINTAYINATGQPADANGLSFW